jgi:3'-phosphoadenosine 5'-phosphosulfate sulfotransferase (PAPS reductase)/FAD synthetase
MNLEELKEWTFKVFDALDISKRYQIGFSGGKDSHVVLGMYIAWIESRLQDLDVTVVFSDTLLETKDLYSLVDMARVRCSELGITFEQVRPSIEHTFWVRLFGLGYPVPDYRMRWCTKDLKINPMSKSKRMAITGSHLGESTKRNIRLNSCGSSECGIAEIENKVEPIAVWGNCDVWDWLALEGEYFLYKDVFNILSSVYEISESSKSLRMGCAFCPVITRATTFDKYTKGTIPELALEIRDILDELRNAPRILSPRSKKSDGKLIKGAIRVDERAYYWHKIKPYFNDLISYGWLDVETISLVESMLQNRTYPPSYKKEWIIQQEPLAVTWKEIK